MCEKIYDALIKMIEDQYKVKIDYDLKDRDMPVDHQTAERASA